MCCTLFLRVLWKRLLILLSFCIIRVLIALSYFVTVAHTFSVSRARLFWPEGSYPPVAYVPTNGFKLFLAALGMTRRNIRLGWFGRGNIDDIETWAIHSFAHFWWAKWAICSHCWFPLSDLSKSLMVAHFWWVKWAFRSHHSFDLSEMSDSLTSLTKNEKMSENEWFTHFFKISLLKNLN